MKKKRNSVTTWARRAPAIWMLGLIAAAPAFGQISGWPFMRQISITNPGGVALTNQQALVTLDTAELIAQGKMRADGGDIRFNDIDLSPLNFWLEAGINTTGTLVWVKLPVLPVGGKTIVLNYGNLGATSQSSLTNTFSTIGNSTFQQVWFAGNRGIVITSGAVSVWTDQSGKTNNVTQATASRRPILQANALNRQPALQFAAASSQTMTLNKNFPAPYTALYVARQTGGTNGRVFSGLNNNWLLGFHGGRRDQFYAEGWVNNPTTPSDTNWYLYESTGSGSLSTFYNDGAQLASNASGVQGPNGLALVGYLAGSEFSDCQIAELLLFSKVLSTAERLEAESFLNNKYRLYNTASLPTTTIGNELILGPSIGGRVTNNLDGAAVEGITISFSGLTNEATTSMTGYYFVSVPSNWSGTVTPGGGGGTYSPASRSYSDVTSGIWGADFQASGVVPFSFSLVLPTNGTMNWTTPSCLEWQRAPNASGYEVYFGTATNPSLFAATAANTLCMTGQLAGGRDYYWYVVATNVTGSTRAPTTGSFTLPSGAAAIPYFNDFETTTDHEWTTNTFDGTQPYYFSTFSGRFGNTNQTLTLTNLTVGSSYTVGFDLYIIDSWDGGADVFSASINNILKLQESFANSVAQTNPRVPDEGRAHFGFDASSAGYVDAIYRNIELVFTATTDVAQVTFKGQGLEVLANESWGLDNVGVTLTTNLVQTTIRSSSLPLEGTVNTLAVDRIVVSASRNLLLSTATNAANYELREAGWSAEFGDGDDVLYTLTPSFTTGKSVRLTFNNSPLQPGRYRLQVKSTLRDLNNNAVVDFNRIFSIAHPSLGRIENTDNGLLVGATVLPMTETPLSGGFLTALGMGTHSAVGDVDYWSFSAEAGDRVTVRVESQLPGSSPKLRLRNASDGDLSAVDGDITGVAQIQNYTITAPGTYFFRVWSDSLISPYKLRVDHVYTARRLEVEANDTQGQATSLLGFNNYPLQAAGSLIGTDSSGDLFNIGSLNVGDIVTETLLLPSVSTLTSTGTIVAAQSQGSATDLSAGAGTSTYTVTSNAVHYVHVYAPAGRDLRSQYLLNISVQEATAPAITSVSLPAEATTNTSLISVFTVGFSEEMSAATVTSPGNYELRSAGVDGVLETGDDDVYALTITYSGGLSASYLLANGPLQLGPCRFTIGAGLLDRALNPLTGAYVRAFTMAPLTGVFMTEGRTNGSVATATSVSMAQDQTSDGSFVGWSSPAVGANPWGVVLGYFNADTNLDLATANNGAANVSVKLGNGDGTFSSTSTYSMAANPIGLAAGDLNGDGKLDLVTANNGATNASVRLGNGDGTFGAVSNYTAGTQPYSVALGDVNGDGKLDMAVANYQATNVSLRLGNGDGTFGALTNLTVGIGPVRVIMGDVNGDGNLDLVTANYSASSVSVRLGNGNGTFAGATNYATSTNPHFVTLGDVNGDGKLDIATANYNANNSSILLGNGDGTFAAAVNYGAGTSPIAVALADISGDGKLDLIVANDGAATVSVLLGNGNGTFFGLVNYGVGTNPRGLALGDVNNDGRLDLAVANFSSASVTILVGNRTESLTEDPSGSGMRSGEGRGYLTNTSDGDFWSFYGRAGDLVTVAMENPGSPGASQLRFDLFHPNGSSVLSTFYPDYNGRGQSSPITLPVTGRYTVRVTYNYDYQGEYQMRITTVAPPRQMETEGNDSVGAASTLIFAISPGLQTAAESGYIGVGDGNGDYFGLGNLVDQTEVRLSLSKPANSTLTAFVGIYNAAGTLVTNSAAGATNFLWVVKTNAAYFARVWASSGAGLLAQYLLDITVADVLPPAIASVSLPAQATTNTAIIDRFTVGFTEDMSASTVTSAGNYDLRAAGVDGALDTADDEIYGLTPSYSSGLSASYSIVNGPLQPGLYRFTISAALLDRALNPLTGAYVRVFTMAALAGGYVTEGRTNASVATATSVSLSPDPASDGSFSVWNSHAMGANPWGVVLGQFNADTNLDLVTANYGAGSVSVRLGNGDATFATTSNYAMAANPIGLAAADLNGDGKLDLVTANNGATNASVRLGNGDGTFGAASNYTAASQPYSVALADVNADGKIDMAVANYNAASVSVRLGNGDGTFGAVTNLAVATGPVRVLLGDVNADGKPDLVTANYSVSSVSVRLGNGDGTFAGATNYATATNPHFVTMGDVNGDGKPDLVTANYGANNASVLLGNGDGTFAAAVNYGAGTSPIAVALADISGDGILDLIVANDGSANVYVLLGSGNGTFFGAVAYGVGTNPRGLALGDVNNDGRLDLAVANYGSASVTILLGNRTESLAENPAGSGMRSGQGRGNLMNTSDTDFWSFYGRAGDIVTIAMENPGSPGASQIRYDLFHPNGASVLSTFYPDYNGRGQSSPIGLPVSGRYTVRVTYNYDYQGEYQMRITTVTPPRQMETEANDSVGAPSTPTFAISAGLQTASIAGYIGVGDGSGDYYRLGNLVDQTQIRLALTRPTSSGLIAFMGIYNAAGTLITNSAAGATNFVWTVNTNAAYFARVWASSGAGLQAQYIVDITLADVLPPAIASVSLPAEGTTNTAIYDRFTVGFTEEMSASTVTSAGNYDLRAAGVDGALDTADDEIYALTPSYSSGLSASYSIVNGPLQPGAYRFTISAALLDRALNPLTGAYVRAFTMAPLAGGYVTEGRTNASVASATSVSLAPEEHGDGSFTAVSAAGVGVNPWGVVLGHFNADTNLDMAVANFGAASVSVRLGIGDGTFAAVSNYTAGVNPLDLAAGDLNGDGWPDLVIGNYGSTNVGVRLGNGDGTFGAVSNYAAGINPYSVALADLNGDTKLDLAVANYGANNVSVRLGNGNGTFGASVNYGVGNGPVTVALGDLNADGRPDMATAGYNATNVSVRLGNGDGTFAAAVNYVVGVNPHDVAMGDVNGDGKPDLVTANYSANNLSVLLGNGDGTFAAAVNFGVGTSPIAVVIADVNGDGAADLSVANDGSTSVSILLGNGNATFQAAVNYTVGSNPRGLALGDINNDMRPDLAVANYSANNVSILLGNRTESLAENPAGSGMRSGQGRGNLTNTSDTDFWSFFGRAGDIVTIAMENPGSPGASQIRYDLFHPNGSSVLSTFYPDYNGRGQSSPIALPATGRYTVRVTYNYDYQGEYQMRITTVTPPRQMESEANDSVGAPSTPTFAVSAGLQTASVAGYIGVGDGSGDYFRLGNLVDQTEIRLALSRPSSSGLIAFLGIYNAAGTLITNSAAGATNFVWVVTTNAAYFARVWASSGAGLQAQYILDISLADSMPPAIASVSLPSEATTNTALYDRFTVGFTEEMSPSTVTNTGNYNLRAAGVDGALDTADDETYGLSVSYSSGLSASYSIVNGPLQPGVYRFTIGAGLLDRALNPLTGAYVRTFAMLATSGYVNEGRTNATVASATSLSVAPENRGDGSFTAASAVGTGANPWGVVLRDFNADTNLDLAVANFGAANMSVLMGRGDGTYSGAVNYATGVNPLGLAAADLNADGKLDLVTANYGSSNVSVRLGNGDGTFGAVTNYTMGSGAHAVAIGDLNADGKLDLATANYNVSNVSVRLGNGNGTFAAATSYAAGINPYSVALGDVNGDGKLDIASANYGSGTVSLRLGNGDGTFGGVTNLAAGSGTVAVDLSDVNGDGKPDVTAANYNGNNVSVQLGNGDGTFAAAVTNATGTSPIALALGDLNGDGKLDMSVANDGASSVSILMGKGDGTFWGAASYSVGTNPRGVALGDANNDGRPDLAVANYSSANVSILLGNRMESLREGPVGSGMRSGPGRGNLTSTADTDFWSFSGQAGDLMMIAMENPGNPGNSQLRFDFYHPNGSTLLFTYYPDNTGRGQTAPYTLPASGRYTLRVTYNYDYQSEYRLRITTVTPPVKMESEENGTIATANVLTLATSGATNLGSVAGFIRNTADLDYFNIGVVTNNIAVLLTTRIPASSGLKPVVAVYNASGLFMGESAGGRDSDGIAEVWITTSGTYYALVRAGESTGGLLDEYLLDVMTLPTAELSIPNLQVSRINPPVETNILSGQPITFSWVVDNVRSNGTGVSAWHDRVALSLNTTWGDADDIVLGAFAHDGALGGGQNYTNTQTVVLPDGISGSYYLMVFADTANAVYEGTFEWDNISPSVSTFVVNRAPYADLQVEGLTLTAGDENTGVFNIDWTTANRGTAAVTNTSFDRVVVTYVPNGSTLVNREIQVNPPLAVDGTVGQGIVVTAVLAGAYRAQVTTDNRDNIYEFDAISHASAEQNTATVTGDVAHFFTVDVSTNPADSGTATGAGRYPGGTLVALTALANTNALPYRFDRWTEGGVLQSTNTSYSFTATSNRALTANFILPSFQVTVNRQPPAGGAASGAGTYVYGSACALLASPNAGYGFQGWLEGTNVIATSLGLTNVIFVDRTFTAVFYELNPFHNVTTETSPSNVAAVTGAGYYTNGQQSFFSAPLYVTNGQTRYTFQRYTLNGALFGFAREFTKVFAPVDETDMHFVAEYTALPLTPYVVTASGNYTNPVPNVTNYQVTVVFDRTMNIAVEPLVVFSNNFLERSLTPPTNGTWLKTTATNDTYRTRVVAFTNGMDGPWTVTVSRATDPFGFQIAETNVMVVQVNSAPPAAPAVTNYAMFPATNNVRTTSVTLQGTRDTNTAVWINNVERVPLGSGEWSYAQTGLAQGTNLLTLYDRNAIGNVSSSVVVRFFVDSVAPSVTAVFPVNNAATNASPAFVRLTYTEATSGLDTNRSTYGVTRSGVPVAGTWLVTASNLTFTPGAAFTDGAYAVSATLVDQLSNTGTFSSAFTVDTIAPVAPGVNPVVSPTEISSQTVTGTKETNADVRLNGVQIVGITAASTWSFLVNLVEGDQTLAFTSRDAAGNTSAATAVQITYTNVTPGFVTVTANGRGKGTEVSLSWTTYDELTNGGDIALYTIYRSLSAFTNVDEAIAIGTKSAGQKTFTATNLTRNTTYYFGVVARDTSGHENGQIASSVAVTTEDIQPPPNPANLTFDSGWSNLTVHWTAASNPDGDLTAYKIYFNNETAGTDVGLDLQYERSGLLAATAYPVRVISKDAGTNESSGLSGTGITLLRNPTNVVANPYDRQVTLSWNGSTPTQYVREYRVYDDVGAYTSVLARVPAATVTGRVTSVVVTGLQNQVTYYFAVAAVNLSGGTDPNVTTVTATPLPDTNGPSVASVTYDYAALTNGMLLTRTGTVRVQATDQGGVARVHFIVDGTTRATDANGGTNYSWSWNLALETDGQHALDLAAVDTAGNTTLVSRTVSVLLAAPAAAPAITNPVNRLVTTQSVVTVRGTAPTYTTVELSLENDAGLSTVTINVDTNGRFSADTPLTDGINRLIAVALNRGGYGPTSDVVLVTVDHQVPDEPTNLTSRVLAGGTVRLDWMKPDTTTMLGYNVYRSASSFTTASQAVKVNSGYVTLETYNDLPASDGTYFYRVTRVNLAGTESPLSTETSAISDRQSPSAVSIAYMPQGAYDPGSGRMGLGLVQVILTASEHLSAAPYLGIAPAGGSPITVLMKDAAGTVYTGEFTIVASTPSGTGYAIFSGRDAVGNRGTDIGSGATIQIDTDGPKVTGLAIQPGSPLRNSSTNPLSVTLTAVLDDEVKTGTTPTFRYLLSGHTNSVLLVSNLVHQSALTWGGEFRLPPDAGASVETLDISFSGLDDLNNSGTLIVPNHTFEVYQGDLPALSSPFGLKAESKPAGRIALSWQSVNSAQDYQLYRKAPGEDQLTAYLRSGGLLSYTDAPTVEGIYYYAIASVRQQNGQESVGVQSPAVSAVSDATAPLRPTDLAVQLVGRGVQVDWTPPPYTEPIKYNLYRAPSGPITTVAGLSPLAARFAETAVIDPNPSKTDHYYTVTSVDDSGNESAPADSAYLNFQLLPVNTLNVYLTNGALPWITWSHAYPQDIAGYDIYWGAHNPSNRLNSSLLSTPKWMDSGYSGADRTYVVVALDAQSMESASRSILLPPLRTQLQTNDAMLRGQMNRLHFSVTNGSATAVSNIQMRVAIGTLTNVSAKFHLQAGQTQTVDVVMGGGTNLPDTATVKWWTEITPNAGELVSLADQGSIGVYDGRLPMDLVVGEATRGGTLSAQWTLQNSGSEPVEVITATANGSQPSTDVHFRLVDADGNVYATAQQKQSLGTGIVALASGEVVARAEPGELFTAGSVQMVVPTNAPTTVYVEVDISRIFYHRGLSDETVISGQTIRRAVNLADTPYYAMVTNITPALSMGRDPIVIQGAAFNRASGQPEPTVPVKLTIALRGLERTYDLTTDAAGNFTQTFQPLATEAGLYGVWALHPDLRVNVAQMEFTISRVLLELSRADLRLPTDYTYPASLWVKTGDGTSVSNLVLSYEAAAQPGGVLSSDLDIVTGAAFSMGPKQQKNIGFTIRGNSVTSGVAVLLLKSDETGTSYWQRLEIAYEFSAAQPSLKWTPNYVEVGLAQDGIASKTLTLENNGLATLKGAQVQLLKTDGSAAPSWINLETSGSLGDMPVGDKRDIGISFFPDENVSSGMYTFNLRVTASNYTTQVIWIYASVTQSGVGDVLFKISDMYTGTLDKNTGEIIQGLKGASIRIQNEAVLTIDQTATTDELGEHLFTGLPAGWYKYRIMAAGCDTKIGRLEIQPGVAATETVALDNQVVSVQWSVEPVTIQDRYEIVLRATYETDVPRAVVVIEPASISLPPMKNGDVFNGQLRMVNYGLVRADNVKLTMPPNNQYFEYELLDDVPATMDAKQVVVMPYRVRCIRSPDDTSGGGGCVYVVSCVQVGYTMYCANNHEYSAAVYSCFVYASGGCTSTSTGRGTGPGQGTWRCSGCGPGTGTGTPRPTPSPIKGDCECACDSNGNGVPDSCYLCASAGGQKDSCYQCDANNDGKADSCFLCDNNGDGNKDSCYTTDKDGDGKNDSCYVCDANNDGIKDVGFQCDTDGDGKKDACFTCDTDGDGKNDRCYDCKDNSLRTFNNACMCDTDGNGSLDICASCKQKPLYGTSVSFEQNYDSIIKKVSDAIESIASKIPLAQVKKKGEASLSIKGSEKFICCKDCDTDLALEVSAGGSGGVGIEVTYKPWSPIPDRCWTAWGYGACFENTIGLSVTGSGEVNGTAELKKKIPCDGWCLKAEGKGSLSVTVFVGLKAKLSVYGKKVSSNGQITRVLLGSANGEAGASATTGGSVTATIQAGEEMCSPDIKFKACFDGFELKVPLKISLTINISSNMTYSFKWDNSFELPSVDPICWP